MRRTGLWELSVRLMAVVGICAAMLWVASCNLNGKPESDQQIRQQAQDATVKAKRAADEAAKEARIAAANARREAGDVASGVKAGLHNGRSAVDLNSASRAELETLPGVNATTARRIEARRPYDAAHDVVRKGAVSEDEYDRIAGEVAVR